MAEYVIFYVGALDKFTGEQIVALDSLRKKEGILSHTYEVDEGRLSSMIKGTVVEKYQRINSSDIKQAINNLPHISKEGKAKVVIDHCFDVKGVGTVVLGKVVSGRIKQYDKLKLLPAGIEVMIKSIQMHDDPVDEANSPARVGLSLKGVSPDDVGRGDYLCEDDTMDVKSEIEIELEKNPFYKGEITENQMCLVNIGLQIKPGKFSSLDPVKLILEKPAACNKGDTCVILKPESTDIRILGRGQIL